VVELGYADAKAREEDLARFFEDAPLEERALAG
jgi:hypothetical protein